MIAARSNAVVLSSLTILTWQVFLCTGTSISPITSSSEKIMARKTEGLTLERKETTENSRKVQLLSHEDLVTEMIEMRKELKSQNGRLEIHEQKITNQGGIISMLESALSNHKGIEKEKALTYVNTNQRLKTEMKRTNFENIPNRDKREATSSDPENPDSEISIKGKFSGEPTSCNDLRQIGHYLNGYYLVKQNENTETVFCHFKEPTEGEELTKVKSSADPGVHFFVQRNREFATQGVIPFHNAKLNIGGAINLSTGIFSAPQDGVYHFAFSGMMKVGVGMGIKLYVLLRRNMNETIAVAHSDVGANTIISPTLSFTATVRLLKGDRIDLYKTNHNGIFYDSSYYSYTSYTGSLLME